MTCRRDVSRGTNPSNTCAEWPIPARRMSVGPSPPQSTTSSCTLSATPMKLERADGGIPWASTDPPVAIAAARVRTAAVVRRDTVLVVRRNGRMRVMSAPPANLFVSDRPWASVCGLTDRAQAAGDPPAGAITSGRQSVPARAQHSASLRAITARQLQALVRPPAHIAFHQQAAGLREAGLAMLD